MPILPSADYAIINKSTLRAREVELASSSSSFVKSTLNLFAEYTFA